MLLYTNTAPNSSAYLSVFVNKHQGIWYIVIPQVYHTAAHPVTNSPLTPSQDGMHCLTDTRSRLDTIQSLTRITQAVAVPFPQHICLCQVPQLEHLSADLTPQCQGL